MKGRLKGNLYFLDGSTVIGSVAASSSSEDDASDTSRLWYMRLAHVGEKALQGLIEKNLLKGAKTGKLEFCKYYVLGKQTRIRFGTAIHRTKEILDYVHTQTGKKIMRLRSDNGESKLDPRAKKVVFLGFSEGVKGYKLWCPESKKEEELKAPARTIQTVINPVTNNPEEDPVIDNKLEENSEQSADEHENLVIEISKQIKSITTRKPKRVIKQPGWLADMVTYALPVVENGISCTFREAEQNEENRKGIIDCKWKLTKKNGDLKEEIFLSQLESHHDSGIKGLTNLWLHKRRLLGWRIPKIGLGSEAQCISPSKGKPNKRRTKLELSSNIAVVATTCYPRFCGVIEIHRCVGRSGCNGAVTAITGFLGLSGAILIQAYQTIFKDKPTSFLLMLATFPTFNTLLLMCFVRIYRTSEGDEKKHLNGFSLIALIIAAYLMVIIILENILSLPLLAHIFTFVILILLLASPLCIAIKAQLSESRSISSTSEIGEEPLMDDPNQFAAEKIHARQDLSGYHQIHSSADQEIDTNVKKTLQLGENLNLLQAMCTSSFWLLFVAMACGMGSGLATVNNISQIGESLGYTNLETSSLVSLWSIWNFLGRFGAGYISDYFLHMNGWARPVFMAITLATMSIGHAVIASGFPGALYIGSVLVGSIWEQYLTRSPIASPVGSYFLSVRVVGYIYDREASMEGDTCIGTHCFMLSFFIMSSAALLGFLAALILLFRTRKFYQQVVLRRLRQSVGE
ncbi:hypothetical protein HYC85_004835 [Camellia sinensis]|uniref:Nodulin-like domain-containing protein n=1 Tax=Camellia sinensis TaxID=4442 RepID=A0A7J7HXP3_CAMSI|nr:hypothetical protein HYC85_004835 [Camellia sinensis]